MLWVLQFLATFVEDASVQDPDAEMTPKLVSDRVSHDRCSDNEDEHQQKVNSALAGDHAAEDGRGLAWQHETHEQGVLGEHERGDNQVDPGGVEVDEMVDHTRHRGNLPGTAIDEARDGLTGSRSTSTSARAMPGLVGALRKLEQVLGVMRSSVALPAAATSGLAGLRPSSVRARAPQVPRRHQVNSTSARPQIACPEK